MPDNKSIVTVEISLIRFFAVIFCAETLLFDRAVFNKQRMLLGVFLGKSQCSDWLNFRCRLGSDQKYLVYSDTKKQRVSVCSVLVLEYLALKLIEVSMKYSGRVQLAP